MRVVANDNFDLNHIRATMTRVRFGLPVELCDYHDAAFELYIMASQAGRGCLYGVLHFSPEQALANLQLLDGIVHGACTQEAPAVPD